MSLDHQGPHQPGAYQRGCPRCEFEIRQAQDMRNMAATCDVDNAKPPPLGIQPRRLWEEQRLREIVRAMSRYAEADKAWPNEWVAELRDLLRVVT